MKQPTMPPEYRALVRRWNEWRKAARLGLTDEERAEMDAVGAQLEAYELARAERSVIAAVTNDYEDLRAMGDLGGVEL